MTIAFTYYRDGKPVHNFIARLRLRRELIRVTGQYQIEGFTLINTLGAWHGKTEPSFLLELEGYTMTTVKALASELKSVFKQEAVMVKNGRKMEFI